MPSLEIATAQPFFRSFLGSLGMHPSINATALSNISLSNEKRLVPLWKSLVHSERLNLNIGYCKKIHAKFLIKAVLTLEAELHVLSDDGQKNSSTVALNANPGTPKIHVESSSEDSEELDYTEKLRRMKISNVKKGRTPWDKGRKHSAETLKRIRERTKLALQNPKVKMKLKKLGHAQSEETRTKIGVGVRIGWQRRRERLMLQETCCLDWQNLIADAARRGLVGEEELQWGSYETLSKQLQQEWMESREQRKTMLRPKGSRSAPKSLEHRRKIAEAIAAKWADPEYRERVISGLSKYHGTLVGVERTTRKRSSGDAQSRRVSKKKVGDVEKTAVKVTNWKIQQPRLKKSNVPLYKDPLASSKLEMIKNIRAQRTASEVKKNEALDRAKLLIAEAEKAAKVLEEAASRSPIARASLIETRELIAEAIQSIESIEKQHLTSHEDSVWEIKQRASLEKERKDFGINLSQAQQRQVNGIHPLAPNEADHAHSDLYKLRIPDSVNGRSNNLPASFSRYELPMIDQQNLDCSFQTPITDSEFKELLDQTEPYGTIKYCNDMHLPNGAESQTSTAEVSPTRTVTKKWVRGRLVEGAEGE